MSRKCTVCNHSDYQLIDLALAGGDSMRTIALKFKVGLDALKRHNKNHLTEKLTKSKAVQSAKEADSIVSKLFELYNRSLSVQTKTEEAGEWGFSIQAILSASKILEPVVLAHLELEKQKSEKGQENGKHDSDLILRHFMHAIHDYPDVKNRLKESLRSGGNGNGNGGSLH